MVCTSPGIQVRTLLQPVQESPWAWGRTPTHRAHPRRVPWGAARIRRCPSSRPHHGTRRSWLMWLPVLDSGVEPTRRIAHAASSQALDRAGPRPRAVGPTTQPGTSTAASWKDIRLFTLLDSLTPTSCLASVARKEATSTQLCNTSRQVGTRSGAGPAARPPVARRTNTMATQAMLTQTNCMRHHAR